MMQGHYKMMDDDGKQFEVDIPAFTLAVPRTLH
jgi:ApaG protein